MGTVATLFCRIFNATSFKESKGPACALQILQQVKYFHQEFNRLQASHYKSYIDLTEIYTSSKKPKNKNELQKHHG